MAHRPLRRPIPRRHAAPRLFALALLAATYAGGASGAVCRAESDASRRTLVELYTSEGCNSCPPADRWLSGLARTANAVPLAFHVDYWDYLGWRDRFATPAYAQRQRDRASLAGARFVYTPQILVDGRDYSAWRRSRGGLPPAAGAARAKIGLEVDTAQPASPRVRLSARLNEAGDRPGAVAWLALYENGLASEVKAGENAGERLTHDFVVRRLIGPIAFDAGGTVEFADALPLGAASLERSGIAAYVEDSRDGRVLQALNLPLCRR